MSKSINWNLGDTKVFTSTEIGDVLTINGYKENDFVITKNEAGQLVLTDASEGTITISDWSSSTLKSIKFTASGYSKSLSKSTINTQLFNVLTLANSGEDASVYSSGSNVRQQFDIDLNADTNIVISSVSGVDDRIKFIGHLADNFGFRIVGNDLQINDYIYNAETGEETATGGRVVIENYKENTVKTLEFDDVTYHLVIGNDTISNASETYSDRYVFLDNDWKNSTAAPAPWVVTVEDFTGMAALDFRFLPNNSRYYSITSETEGRDMILSYNYSPTSSTSAVLGTIRLKNFYNEDGSVNTENGYTRIRTIREVYAGGESGDAWDSWVWERNNEYRNLRVNAGTSGDDTIDLGEYRPFNNKTAWLYYAGDGDDTVTARQGDIVYGGAGADTINAVGRLSEVHGGAGKDIITVRGADGGNRDHVVVRADGGNDTINVYGSYNYINGGRDNDEIHIYTDPNAEEEEVSHNNGISSGQGDDKLYIHAGHHHVVNGGAGNDEIYFMRGHNNKAGGGAGNDKIYANFGNGHMLYGGAGDDEIHIVDNGSKVHTNNTANGGLGNDTLSIENGGQGHFLFGEDGVDYLSVEGDNNVLDGGNENDTLVVVAGEGNMLNGGDGDDELYVESGNENKLYGGAGNDIMTIIAGNDNELHGDEGDDKLNGGSGNDTLNGGDGNDKLYGESGNDYLYGQRGNDKLYGGDGDDTLNGGVGDDTLYGQRGDDILTGGTGKDTFVYYTGYGNDTITDYTAGKDVIQIASGNISKTEVVNGTDVKFTIGSGSMTLTGGAGEAISIKDSRGSYTASNSAIVLGSDFRGTMDAGAYLGTVTTINGQAVTSGITVQGNANANTINGGSGNDTLNGGDGNDKLYGESGNDYLYGQRGNDKLYGGDGDDTLNGGVGDDTLYGQRGDDILTGGTGKDTFVYYTGYGNDTITDYTAGKDVIQIASGNISKTEVVNGTDVKFTIGSGSMTLTGGAGEAISIKDSRGSYTASKTAIVLGSDFTGEMDAGKYLETVTRIDGRSSTNAVTLKGNAGNNRVYGGEGSDTLYGGAGDDELYGGAGDDTLTGGTGNDTFVHYASYGNDTIADYVAGEDVIKFASGSISKTEIVNGTDVKFTVGNGSVTVKDGAGKVIDYYDSFGELHSVALGVTQQSVIKNFMKSLDDSTIIVESPTEALNAAVSYASNGFFVSWESLINRFTDEIKNFGATTYAQSKSFLNTYCGINLNNTDTGAITGADAGGAVVKDPEGVVPEAGTIEDLQHLSADTTTMTIDGLTFSWNPTDVANEQAVLDRLYTWWAKGGLDLVEESYGLSFNEEGTMVNDINVEFEYNENSSALASVNYRYYISGSSIGQTTALTLTVNMSKFSDLDLTDVSGYAGPTSGYLDRTLAHEFTHAAMAANITGFGYLPNSFVEGSAELVHGIDDFRSGDIQIYALAANSNALKEGLADMRPNYKYSSNYAGGYMMLRYFAKQSAEHFGGEAANAMIASADTMAASVIDSVNTAVSSVTDSVTSAVSSLWSETTAAVADVGSEMVSAMNAVSNAMLTPLDSTDANLLGSDSLTSGLFSENKNGQNFLG